MITKATQNEYKFVHQNGDVFTYDNSTHTYKLNGIELPGTTTPLTLVNELSWDENGVMSDKSSILQKWALGRMADEAIEKAKELFADCEKREDRVMMTDIEQIIIEAKKAPNKRLKSAGVSGTQIHDEIEKLIKQAIKNNGGYIQPKGGVLIHDLPQVQNFINWATRNLVKFLYSEEPIYSKEWMNCGTVDFICEIGGKILVGDIKTNGDKRRFKWLDKEKRYDFKCPVSDIHINALFQTGAYAKMVTESDARKLVEKVDGVVIVNIKKGGDFDESLDVRYDYNLTSLIEAYNHIIKLYKIYRNK